MKSDHYYFFFFQAEDGIRDKLVTGVQTCALPISTARRRPSAPRRGGRRRKHVRGGRRRPTRSEERRVGKECRSRGSPDHEEKKNHAPAAVVMSGVGVQPAAVREQPAGCC